MPAEETPPIPRYSDGSLKLPEPVNPLAAKLAHEFPGLLHPDRAPLSASGLIGFLQRAMASDERLAAIALARLPAETEKPCPTCGSGHS